MSRPVALDVTGFAKIHHLTDKDAPVIVELTTDQDAILERIRCHPYFFLQDAQQPGPGLPNGLHVLFRAGGYIRHITRRSHRVEGKVIEVYADQPEDVYRVPIRSTLAGDDRHKPCFWKFDVAPHIRKDRRRTQMKLRVRRPFATNMMPGDLVRLSNKTHFVLCVKKVQLLRKNDGSMSKNWVWVHVTAPPWVGM